MDKPPPDDFDPYRDESMQIHGDIPKSTLGVAAILWSILFAMQAWHLVTTLNMQQQQAEQRGDIRVIQANNASEISRINSNLLRIEDHNRTQDRRLETLESKR